MGLIEYTNVSLKMIVDSGLVKPGTDIYSSSQPQVVGTINHDGSITLFLNDRKKTYNSPSGAARAVVKLSVNGWTFWKLLINSEYKELTFLRELYNDRIKGSK